MKAKFINEVLSDEDDWANREISKNVPDQEEPEEIKPPIRQKTYKTVTSIDAEKGETTKTTSMEERIVMAEEIIELEDYFLENASKEQIEEWIYNAMKIAGDEWEYEDRKTGEIKNVGDSEGYWTKITRYDKETQAHTEGDWEYIQNTKYYHEEDDYYGISGEGKVKKMLDLLRMLVKEIK